MNGKGKRNTRNVIGRGGIRCELIEAHAVFADTYTAKTSSVTSKTQ